MTESLKTKSPMTKSPMTKPQKVIAIVSGVLILLAISIMTVLLLGIYGLITVTPFLAHAVYVHLAIGICTSIGGLIYMAVDRILKRGNF